MGFYVSPKTASNSFDSSKGEIKKPQSNGFRAFKTIFYRT
tara:strand:+ start:3468 stop:3587 length:120 start_codon:yes stop_codon:yes gene_type:complete